MKQISQNIYGNMTVAQLIVVCWPECELNPQFVRIVHGTVT
jgi:hypothetical protein